MQRILVIGGSGFVGRHVVAQLVKAGHKVVVPTRSRDRAKSVWFLPGVDVQQANVFDLETQRRLCQNVDAIVNLVGILHGSAGKPYGDDWRKVHVELPKQLSKLAEQRGIAFVHISAVGVTANAPSMYLRSKYDGEQIIRERKNLAWSILRPSVVFGSGDHFTNLFIQLTRWLFVLPLAGANTPMQPLAVTDLAQAVVTCLRDSQSHQKTYELGGPQVLTLGEIAKQVAAAVPTRCLVLPLPNWLARMMASVMELLGIELLSNDNLDSMKHGNVANAALPGLTALGIQPTSLASYLQTQAQERYLSWRASSHS